MANRAVHLPGLPPLRIGAGTLLSVVLIGALVHPAFVRAGVDTALIWSVAVGAGMLLSVLVHEAAHAALAWMFGARIEHIALTLMGGHTQYRAEHMSPARSALVSLAGPASNAVLGALFAVTSNALEATQGLGTLLFLLSTLNYALAVFNLLPGLPLDGGRALENLATAMTGRVWLGERIAGWAGRVLAVLLVLGALVQAARAAMSTPGAVVVLVVMLMIAGQLWMGASAALRHARATRHITRRPVAEQLVPVMVVRPATPLAQLPPPGADSPVILVADGPRWLRVEPSLVQGVPSASAAATPVTAVATVSDRIAVVHEDHAAEAMVAALSSGQDLTLLVIDQAGSPRGLWEAGTSQRSAPRLGA